MADDSGSHTLIGLLVGGLLVFVVLVFAFGWWPSDTRTADVTVNAPKVEAPDVPDAPDAPSKAPAEAPGKAPAQ